MVDAPGWDSVLTDLMVEGLGKCKNQDAPLPYSGRGDGHGPDRSWASQPRQAPEGPRRSACPLERHRRAWHVSARLVFQAALWGRGETILSEYLPFQTPLSSTIIHSFIQQLLLVPSTVLDAGSMTKCETNRVTACSLVSGC